MNRASAQEGDLLPLTQSQLLLWTGQRLAPQDPLYNMILAFHISGPVDTVRFKTAFAELVNQCDALRIVFESRNEVPRQRFLEHLEYDLPVVDFSREENPPAARQRWIDAHRTHCFSLESPAFHSALLKAGDNDFIWYLNQHHLITDAWSVSIIYRKMAELYRAVASTDDKPVAALPRYQDYVHQYRSGEDTRRYETARAYWQQQLAEPPIPSTFYRKPPPDRGGRTERIPIEFGADRTQSIKALTDDDRFAAFTTDLALFQLFATVLFAYLYRMTGNERLAVGVPSHGRSGAQAKATAGLFIEVFPLLGEVNDDDTFLSLYQKLAKRTQELLMNAEPGVSDFEHSRAFDVVLNYITAAFGDFCGMAMQSEWVHPDHGDRNHFLRLQVHDFDQAGELGLYVDLNTDAFVGEEKQRVAEHLLCLVDALLAEPKKRIVDVPLVAGDSLRWLIEDLNATPDERPVTASVIDMFASQAAATPERVALVCRDRSLTYDELARDADRLSSWLVTQGAGPGTRIAIAMTRSIEAVTAALAVMKSGAAFVPIDPDYPGERIRWIIEDTAAPLVLTQVAQRGKLPDDKARVVEVDAWLSSGNDEAADLGQCKITLSDAAYVIYTSGSTGKPNGVIVHHHGLANYIAWCRKYYLQGSTFDFPLFSSMSFDLTVTSLLLPLVSGGRLIIYDENHSDQEFTIRRVIEDNAVDIVKLTPAHLSLIHAMDFSSSRLKKIVVGGEDFKSDLAATISRYFDDRIEIYNEYGPTEGTVACMIHRFDPLRDTGGSVPIGRSIDNDRVYVLDTRLQPVPQGVVGQICIGGAGVASGYLNQPELTAQRFVPDPFVPGERMYLTGDLARWNSHGVMEYLGRRDHQVKIRGVRIETAEIEAALLEHPQVSDCVADVILRQPAGSAVTGPAFCTECGLDAKHPSAELNDAGICRTCLVYRSEREAASEYFRSMDDLRQLIPTIKASATGEHDCLMLLSGGKDSTYVLCQLVDLGLNPLVFTLDNGYISDGAKRNIRQIVDRLGLELVTGSTPAMNEIFADSLKRYSNVCEGCFKTIYTLSTKLALERGISYIVTGLSRGQIFETRIADLFHQRVFDPEQIDRTVIEARKAYHRMEDAVSRNIDCGVFRDDEVFQKVRYLDFYRYCDVELDDVLDYLKNRIGWVRPKDTGRSTNCLINDVGIYVHKKERGYHNYAEPYSWDVRLGHKRRDAARDELNDRINVDNVHRILKEIGYRPEEPLQQSERQHLVAWYVAGREIPAAELRAHIARLLPDEFVPWQFVRIEKIPLTHNGKVDRRALPEPGLERPGGGREYVEPEGSVEKQLARLWSEILGIERIGIDDSFFDLGGDSILNIQIVARAKQQGLAITPQNIFDHPTIRELAAVAREQTAGTADQGPVIGPVPLTPIQQRYFEHANRQEPERLSQAVLLSAAGELNADRLKLAWQEVMKHHDALRARFTRVGNEWQQVIVAPDPELLEFTRHDLAGLGAAELDGAIDSIAADLNRRINLSQGRLVLVALLDHGSARPPQMLAVIHHLVVDAVSWWVLLQDLDTAYGQLNSGREIALPAKTSSIRQWATELASYAQSPQIENSKPFWADSADTVAMPLDFADGRNDRESARTVSIELDRASTSRLIHEVPAAFRVQVPEVLLAALRRSARWAPDAPIRVDLEGHGREEIAPEIDLLRTVGWFTSVYPVEIPGDFGSAPEEVLAEVKERLRAVPARGLDYGVLRYMYPDETLRARLCRQRPADILFNYLGQWDQTLASSDRFAFERPIMALRDSDAMREHILEVNAMVFDGVLRIDITYSINLHASTTMERFASDLHNEVRKLIDASVDAERGVLTPSDFPSAGLDQDELDSILDEFGKQG